MTVNRARWPELSTTLKRLSVNGVEQAFMPALTDR
jgi:hypothetical protein